jgi:2-C-methyl-D-erythritol 4-phosphate cytidylyltransferase / 2-C-methyl-D-erythritol 2,4-cyclodiphosphate synthase
VDCSGNGKRIGAWAMSASKLPSPAAMAVAAIVVAAGKGLRAGQSVPKQFAMLRGKPVLRHSVEALLAAGIAPVAVAIPEGAEAMAEAALAGLEGWFLFTGGETRRDSVQSGVAALEAFCQHTVLVHDAARPFVPAAVIARLLAALEHADGAIPVLPVADTMARAEAGQLGDIVPRDQLRRVQTPQAFRFAALVEAHARWPQDQEASDDAQMLRAIGREVVLVEGDEALHKLTYAADFRQESAAMRIGFGYDVHRLAECEELWLCGVRIDHPLGLAGHSDADVAIHALVDAILGALAAGDIGQHFPPSDPQWRGASSDRFLAHAMALARANGFALGNADVTIVCEAPKIGPHREAMRTRLATILGVDIAAVSVKATTTEKLGPMGRSEGIAAQAVVSLAPI